MTLARVQSLIRAQSNETSVTCKKKTIAAKIRAENTDIVAVSLIFYYVNKYSSQYQRDLRIESVVMTKNNIDWPAIYLQVSKDGELIFISSNDWNNDVDTRQAISPLNDEKDHCFVDSSENVYRLSNPYMIDSVIPHFESEKFQKTEIVELVKVRAKHQLDKVPVNFSDLVKELDY